MNVKIAFWNVQTMQDLVVFTLTQNPSLCLSTKILVYKAVVIYTLL